MAGQTDYKIGELTGTVKGLDKRLTTVEAALTDGFESVLASIGDLKTKQAVIKNKQSSMIAKISLAVTTVLCGVVAWIVRNV